MMHINMTLTKIMLSRDKSSFRSIKFETKLNEIHKGNNTHQIQDVSFSEGSRGQWESRGFNSICNGLYSYFNRGKTHIKFAIFKGTIQW